MLIALDFETTGLDSNHDEPIQIGMLCMTDNFVYVDHYISLIKPSKSKEELKQTVSLLTGLSSHDFFTAPEQDAVFTEVVQKIKTRQQQANFYAKNSTDKKQQEQDDIIFVGHNVLFDLKFFVKYMKKNNLSLDFKSPECSLVSHNVSRCFCFPLFETYAGLAFVDTYRLSQLVIHFVGSYSLETLKQTMESNELFATMFYNIIQQVQPEGKNKMDSHNALYDCIVSMCLYRFCYDRLKYLTTKYLSDDKKNPSPTSSQQNFNKPFFHFFLPTSLPLVSKPLPTQKKLVKKNDDFGEKFCQNNKTSLDNPNTSLDNSSFFDGLITKINNFFALSLITISIDKFILETIKQNKKIILAVSHSSKLDICKKIYKSLGYDVGFFNENTIIDTNRLFLRLTKSSYTKSEISFLYKYLSHLDCGYSVFDITNDTDSSIMMFLQGHTTIQTKNIILTTHTGLYHMIKNFKETYKDYRIFFFDADRRYTTYNNFSNNFFDPYVVLDNLEKIQYIYSIFADHDSCRYQNILQTLDRLVNGRIIWMGVFFIEASTLCAQYKKHTITLSCLFDTPAFFRTNYLWNSIWSYIENLISDPLFEHKEHFLSLFKNIYELCKKPLCIESKIFGQDGLYFIITTDIAYTDFSEFLDFLRGFDVVFCSHSLKGKGWVENTKDETRKRMYELVSISLDTCQKKVRRVASVKELIEMVNNFDETVDCFDATQQEKQEENLLTNTKKGKNIFILSGIKQNSHEIITVLHQAGFCQKWTLLGENITGGRKKNIIKAFSSDQSKIVVGGFHFLLGLISEGRQWDLLVIYQTMGHMEEVMLDDICWYSTGFQNATKTSFSSQI